MTMKNMLEPAYQPIFDLQAESISHYEALARIRLDETDRGHGALIDLAERHKFIQHVDLAMLALVLEAALEHDQDVAVNVSPFTVHVAMESVARMLATYGQLAGRLIIEITETYPVQDVGRLRRFMAVARESGARVALDDYGNGRGCFTEALVRELEPDFLKLDGAVLKRAIFFGDTRELALASEMARSFGAELIAEFVDSPEEVEYLRAAGVRYAQGAAYGMPCRKPAALASWPQGVALAAAGA